jgi:hypothetical protein
MGAPPDVGARWKMRPTFEESILPLNDDIIFSLFLSGSTESSTLSFGRH